MGRWVHDDERVYSWIRARSGLVRVGDFVGIANLDDHGEIVAAFGYDHHQELSCFMHIGAEPGGLTRSFIRKAYWIPYTQWGYNLTMGLIQGSNLQSRAVAVRLGYAEMLVIPGAHPSGALHLVGMYKKNCPWLLENKNHERWIKRPGRPESVGELTEQHEHRGERN